VASEPTPLDPLTLAEIHAIQWRAKAAFDRADHEEAANLALQAWDAVPEPKYGWDHSYVFLASLFRRARLSARRSEIMRIVREYLDSDFYLAIEDGPHFWLGALLFEEGQFEAAFENLERAARISRGRCFREEDPKYKKFFDERRKRAPSRRETKH
jgi:hypothetical protein